MTDGAGLCVLQEAVDNEERDSGTESDDEVAELEDIAESESSFIFYIVLWLSYMLMERDVAPW